MSATLLELGGLRAWYGASQVLHDIDLQIHAGEVVALAGRNGSGRSTLARAIMGLVRTEGQRQFAGVALGRRRTFEIARLGIGYVPEHRDIFATLSVHDNLLLGLSTQTQKRARRATPRFTLAEAYALFPVLQARASTRAGVLSGGEQQMLALARALLGDPDLLLVDEPVEGLASQVVEQVESVLQLLRARGIALLLIEQRLVLAHRLADRVAVMGHGAIVFDGTLDALAQRREVLDQWLGLGPG
ncbi:ABC transporter ATP-binding protein [Paraburkholderia bonniea]|uniref:ABC transporter ATP-binding protein n=1 Tax=Paraburkholderia bonniea TaxID=2152891 RepID=UPI0012918309|nr:ABC transporter ATP-binding protein [Paraburkholderia bonniea]WJF91069.1 ABC transporter ATP-binding protein [Paraburkholderia bonniea]WJF94383.1 ABC transporter ATP-binding protein [Paraburkholderia bonniea]